MKTCVCNVNVGLCKQASQGLSEKMTDRMDTITKWQDATGDTLRELGRSVQTIPQDVSTCTQIFPFYVSRD